MWTAEIYFKSLTYLIADPQIWFGVSVGSSDEGSLKHKFHNVILLHETFSGSPVPQNILLDPQHDVWGPEWGSSCQPHLPPLPCHTQSCVPISKARRDTVEDDGRGNHKCTPQLQTWAISHAQLLFPRGIQTQYCELFQLFKRIRKSRFLVGSAIFQYWLKSLYAQVSKTPSVAHGSLPTLCFT